MTRRRWIADEFSDDRAALTGAHAAHLSRTLRARVGQQFEVACGDRVHLGTIFSVSDDRVEFLLGEEVSRNAQERPENAVLSITLLLAVFKFDRMEWAIEKCTELNVSVIVPVIARRTEKHLAHAAMKRVERWRRIAREACEQSRRAAPPEVHDPLRLKEALDRSRNAVISTEPRLFARTGGASGGTCGSSAGDLKIVLAETGCEATLAELLRAHPDITSLSLAIGPEGGWAADELDLFQKSHWIAALLGDTILRSETAAIAALAIARAM